MSDSEPSAPKPEQAVTSAARQVGEELEKVGSAPVLRHVRRAIILVIGGTVLLIGIALMILPGPAFLVIPAGLAILGLEFAWARRWLRKARAVLKDPKGALLGRATGNPSSSGSPATSSSPGNPETRPHSPPQP